MTTTAATSSAPVALPPEAGTASPGGDGLVAPTIGGGTTTVPTSGSIDLTAPTAPSTTATTTGATTQGYLQLPGDQQAFQTFRDAFMALALFDAASRLGGGGSGGWVFGPAQTGVQHAIYQLPTQGNPGQVPMKAGGPPQKISVGFDPAQTVPGGGPAGDVELDEGALNAVTLKSGEGNSVKVWGDPHVEVEIDGKQHKFDIGYGAGAIHLSDGTRISWDTATAGNVLDDFRIHRPGADGIEVNTRDGKTEKDVKTGLTDAQIREFAAGLREFEGSAHKPLARRPDPVVVDMGRRR